ncbi:hypothetical protein GCM10027089_34860 [Nocardia thraciensis]
MLRTRVHPVDVVAERDVNHGERDDQGYDEQYPRGGRVHLEPLRKQQRRNHIQGDTDGQNQTDDVLRHSRSTPRWISPSSAKTATVSTVNTTTDMSKPLLDQRRTPRCAAQSQAVVQVFFDIVNAFFAP